MRALNPLDLYYDNNGVITEAKESRSHKNLNIYFGAITLFARSLIEVM
jgi:hypothetical protein